MEQIVGPIIVTVRPLDILLGRRQEGQNCPIARAIKRQTGEYANVGHSVAFIGTQNYDMPAAATTFVDRFDHRRMSRFTLRTFEFTLVPR